MRCRVCRNDSNQTFYDVREMMHGTKERFTYFQCSHCFCLQIGAIPPDMTPYYPPHYIGFNKYNPQYTAKLGIPLWANTMDFDLIEDVLRGSPPIRDDGCALVKQLTARAVAHYLPFIADRPQAPILDVGCGSGEFLGHLAEIGFTALRGVDPYIGPDVDHSHGVKITKGTIAEIEPAWEVIMFHHVFEHVPDPLATIRAVARLLTPTGVCLLRIPLVPSYVWESYGPDWVQLDAPRHFFLHSVRSIDILATQADLRLAKVVYDSNIIQFTGSEQYRRDIPYFDERSYSVNPARSIFSEAEIAAFWQKTRTLNEIGWGDQAAFYLVKQRSPSI